MGVLARVRELVLRIHLAKFTGGPASQAEELLAQNKELESRLKETQGSLARAEAASEMARDLIAKNTELEQKLKEAGLVNLQGKAASYVAQKLIEKNTELEMRVKPKPA